MFFILSDLTQSQYMEHLFQQYYPIMKKKANEILNDFDLADDMVQTAFVKLMKHTDTLQRLDESARIVYLTRTVIHVSVDYIRKHKRKFPDKQDIPFETVESEIEQKETVSSTLELLTEKQRDLLIYYYVMGYKLKEIANIMHLNPKNVSMDLQRARKAALTVLKKGENVDET